MKKILPTLALIFFFSGKIAAQLSATISSTNPACDNNNGSATVNPSGGSGYFYKWNTGATTQTITGLSAGTYTVTVYSSAGTQWDTVYLETFDGPQTWTLNVATGTNDADNNFWRIGGGQYAGGAPVGSCASTSTTDISLHITSVSQALPGATYDAGSQGQCAVLPGLLFCTTTNMAAQSQNISTNGVTNLVVQYDFIGSGQGTIDNGSSFYSENGGTNFVSLDNSLKSLTCGPARGLWTLRSYNLPSTCNNISDFRIRFNWTNDDDAAGTDPSVAINNILLRDSIPLPGDSVVQTVTLTVPPSPHFVTAALSVVNPSCGQNNGSINNMGVAGGTSPYTLVWKISGAQIGTGNSLTSIGAGTYTFEVTDQNGCMIDTSIVLISLGGGGNVTVETSKPVFCASDSTVICVTTTHDSYLWNIGDTTRCITTKLAGNYYVTVTDNPNCTGTSNHLAISVYPSPPVSISVDGDTLSAYGAVAYQWYLNGNAINAATDSVYIATQSGNYSVAVTDTNGCMAFSTNVSVTISGVNELLTSNSAFRIFPNPADGDVNVLVSADLVGEKISVCDVSGRLLMEQRVTSIKEKLEITTLQVGYFLIRVGNRMQRFIKL